MPRRTVSRVIRVRIVQALPEIVLPNPLRQTVEDELARPDETLVAAIGQFREI